MAEDWNRRSALNSWASSRTRRWKGRRRMRSSVDFWYFRISRRLCSTQPSVWRRREEAGRKEEQKKRGEERAKELLKLGKKKRLWRGMIEKRAKKIG